MPVTPLHEISDGRLYYEQPDLSKLDLTFRLKAPGIAIMNELSIAIRMAKDSDGDLLWSFLAIAAYEANADAARAIPVVAAHLDGWLRPGDFGVLASVGAETVGAAWARQFAIRDNPTFYVDDKTPEVSIGVTERARGYGVGRRLLTSLISEARIRRVGLCLNVRDNNPAVALYEKVGFARVPGSDVANRVGGHSIGMLLPRCL